MHICGLVLKLYPVDFETYLIHVSLSFCMSNLLGKSIRPKLLIKSFVSSGSYFIRNMKIKFGFEIYYKN